MFPSIKLDDIGLHESLLLTLMPRIHMRIDFFQKPYGYTLMIMKKHILKSLPN